MMNWIFKGALLLNGFPINEALNNYSHLLNNPIDNQNRAFKQFIYFKEKSAFYKKFLFNKRIEPINHWNMVPIISKKDFQVGMDKVIEGWNSKELHIHNTSGSSGTPFYFAKDKFCHAMTWAHTNAKFSEHDLQLGASCQARFYGIPLDGFKYCKERLKDMLSARIRFPVFDLSDIRLAEMVKIFKKHDFIYINGYTSSLVLFAKYLISNNVLLKDICPSLQLVMPTSEICDDLDRKILKDGFGVKVVNEYGAAELDLIAMDDIDGDFVLNEETLYVEILDEQNKPVLPGVEGRVVITSLFNQVMPFIRYEIGDSAVFSDKLKNGRRILERVVGRTNDIIKLPSGKVSPGLTFYYISKRLLEGGGKIKEFVIRQTTINTFVLEYVSDSEMSSVEKEQVMIAVETYLEAGLELIFIRKEKIERTKAGKLKHFFSEI
jgi:phenylacetate-CoA ligase